MAFFDWSSGIRDTLNPVNNGMLPGTQALSGWKLVRPYPQYPGEDIEFGTVLQYATATIDGKAVLTVRKLQATAETLGANAVEDGFAGIAIRDMVGQQARSIGTPQIISQYPRSYPVSVLRKGATYVPIQAGNPEVGGKVWVKWKINTDDAHLPVGGIETAQSTITAGTVLCNVIMANAKFGSVGMYPLRSTQNGTSATATTGKVAVVELDM
jgi:hypothetical protein